MLLVSNVKLEKLLQICSSLIKWQVKQYTHELMKHRLAKFEYKCTLKRSPLYPRATRKMFPNKSHLQRKLENESQSQSSISLIPELRWKDGTGGIKKIMGCTNDHVDM
jgi:hypothetical protein